MATRQACSICKFNFSYIALDQSKTILECRRFPPNANRLSSDQRRSDFPIVRDRDFCGEFQPQDGGA